MGGPTRIVPCNVLAFERERVRGDEAVERFPDGYFDLVFIDADHDFTPVRNDILKWLRKVRAKDLVVASP